jgi:redox-sensitive bicupin YhaK (pirin superfamily)
MNRRLFLKGSAIIGATIAVPEILKSGSGLTATKNARKIHRVLNTDKTMVGTLPVLRAFAGDHNDYVSPFVFFDEFGPVNVNPKDKPLRVDAHPHAGIVPTTYFLAGSGHHKDSLNYDFQIGKGDFMMFTSGRGAIHMEETGQKLYDNGGIYHGFQIWLNLPSKFKWIDPTTQVYKPELMGAVDNKDYSATIVLGDLNGVRSKVETLFPVFYYHVKLKPNGKLNLLTDPAHNAFVYVIRGNVEADDKTQVKQNQVVLYQRGATDLDLFSAEGAELLICGGQPHNDPVFAYGPFVMNNEAEIRKCFADYQSGKMGHPDAVNN